MNTHSLFLGFTAWVLTSAFAVAAAAPGVLKVSPNHHYLVTGSGEPFFWLGDTAWELFHQFSLGEATHYLEKRAAQGYTVIQAVALAQMDGLNTPNAQGHRPLVNNDPLVPDVRDGPDNDYWDDVDAVVRKANELGLVIGFLPTWGDKWQLTGGQGPVVFTNEATARSYGKWLGQRYKDASVVWILGGDRNPKNKEDEALQAAMATGLREGDGGCHLITYHPTGRSGSSNWFHDAPWLDFNARQNGHGELYGQGYAATRNDYDRTPAKPVIDLEPLYEDHPLEFKAAEYGHSLAPDVRRCFYWNVLSGACGHTYGHHSVWQMARPGQPGINGPLMSWKEALDQPGGVQMAVGRRLLESRPWWELVPDQSLVIPHRVPTSVPGAGRYHFVTARTTSGSCALIYVPAGREFGVDLDKLSGTRVKAFWYDPRTGKSTAAGEFEKKGHRNFISPTPGESLDWVLVLDDAVAGFGDPGVQAYQQKK